MKNLGRLDYWIVSLTYISRDRCGDPPGGRSTSISLQHIQRNPNTDSLHASQRCLQANQEIEVETGASSGVVLSFSHLAAEF